MSRAAGAIRVVRSRVKKIRAPQRQALTFTPAAITKLQVQIFSEFRNHSIVTYWPLVVLGAYQWIIFSVSG